MDQDSGAMAEVQEEIDSGVLEQAENAGVDVEEAIADTLNNYSDYSPSTLARFASSEIERRIEAAQAETVRGIIMGSRDRHDKNWPRRHSLVRSSGDHLEVSSWDGALPTEDGTQVKIPTGGAIVKLACDYDSEYESYEAQRIESVRQLKDVELVENLSEVAVGPSDLSPDDEYDVVCVKGEIAYIEPQTIFEDGEPSHDGSVLMEDERGDSQPHFEILLQQDGDTRLRGHLERQGYGRPYVDLTDLEPLLNDASESFDDPEDQAQFLEDGLKGQEMILVGNVNSYDKSRDDDGVTHYVDLGLTAAIDMEMGSTAATLDSATEPETEDTDDEPAEPESEPEPEPEADDESDESTEESGRDIEEVRSDIEQYADLVGIDTGQLAGQLTVEDINEKMDLDDPDPVIRRALQLHEESDESDDEAAEEDAEEESADTALDRIRNDDDMLECPACEGPVGYQCGLQAELVAHIHNEHDDDMTPDDLEQWVAERV